MAIDLTKPWHYIANGQTIGPISGNELVSLIGRGVVQASTKVWTPGQTGWVDASTYPDLFSVSSGMAPPPPPMDMAPSYAARYDQTAASSTTTAEGAFRPAGFWIRVVAYVIDALILYGIYALVVYFDLQSYIQPYVANLVPASTVEMLRAQYETAMQQSMPNFVLTTEQISFWTTTSVITAAIGILYVVLLQGSPLQATIGKAIVGIRLRNSGGNNVGLIRSFWRYLMMFISSLLLGLGFLIIPFNRDKKALHDFLAGTRVVYRRS